MGEENEANGGLPEIGLSRFGKAVYVKLQFQQDPNRD